MNDNRQWYRMECTALKISGEFPSINRMMAGSLLKYSGIVPLSDFREVIGKAMSKGGRRMESWNVRMMLRCGKRI